MAVNKNNIILNLPFDESDGSLIAYDYSTNLANGVISGAKFVSGKIGNAVQLSGEDTCEVSKNVLNLSGDFSLMCWINPAAIQIGSPSKVIWMLAFDGVNQFVEIPIELSCGNWVSVAITKKGAIYNFYANASLVKTVNRSGSLIGVSLNQDYYGGEFGKGSVDDLKVYNIALSQADLTEEMSAVKQLTYYIDGVDLKEYGVYVSASEGLLDRPKMKAPLSVSWDNYHGSCVDLNHKFYENREITLSCFIKAEGKGDFVSKVNQFLQVFDKKGTNRLMVDIHPTKPLVYEVYSSDNIAIKKTWDDNLMVGTFSLKLIEPSPVKKVLKFMRVGESTKDCSIKLTITKLVDIYWGDGEVDTDIYGTDVTINHTFKNNGDYYIIVAGCVDEIDKFEAKNTIIVWNKL